MDVSIITGTEALNKALADLFKWAKSVDMAVAWASSGKGEASHWLALDIEKISRAAIGVAFAGTEPAALLALHKGANRLRIVQSSGNRTYHPKVIVGRNGRKRRAIVGSANLTVGAYTSNTELCVLLCGADDDQQFEALDSFLDDQWLRGVELDLDWLPEYAKSVKRARAKRKEIRVPPLRWKSPLLTTLLMTWNEYLATMLAHKNRILSNAGRIKKAEVDRCYMGELDGAAKLFRKRGGFAELTEDERTFLMGEGHKSSGLLGSMGGAATAMHIARKEAWKLSAIDTLPIKGQLTLVEVGALLEALTEPKGVGLGVATRLMAAKRPDLFVSVNQKSEPRLAAARQGRHIRSIRQYLAMLSELWGTKWYQAARPRSGIGGAIWDRRAALLDAALYEYVSPK